MRSLKLFLVLSTILAVSVPLFSQGTNDADANALTKARTISNEIMGKLRTALLDEMGKGGAAGAVQVCATVAQEIPQAYNQSHGQFVRRVSQGYRNPKDKPDKYELTKLRAFDQFNHEKQLAAEYSEVVTEKGKRYLRYMKPLIASAMCLQCHGEKEKVAASVRQIIAEKYPQDKAFGYHEGDVRGAISVKILLPKK